LRGIFRCEKSPGNRLPIGLTPDMRTAPFAARMPQQSPFRKRLVSARSQNPAMRGDLPPDIPFSTHNLEERHP
jgi:hypothetical protein